MNKLIALILCFMFATPAFADGKVASIKEVPTPEVLVKYRKLRDQTEGW